MSLHPNSELVTLAWLASLDDLDPDIVGTDLPSPSDLPKWIDLGFIQVGVPTGTPNGYVPIREPVMGLTCWAYAPDSDRPPWNKAAQLAEIVYAAALDHATVPRLLTLPSAYLPARVLTVSPQTEPRRFPGDPGSYARFQMDLSITWTEVPA